MLDRVNPTLVPRTERRASSGPAGRRPELRPTPRRYLDAHINLEKTVAVSAGHPEGLSLDAHARSCDVLGDPQRDYPVIHVTGTNGKGSTARMVAALLAAHRLSVGTYTSPHLEHITERIARNLRADRPTRVRRRSSASWRRSRTGCFDAAPTTSSC